MIAKDIQLDSSGDLLIRNGDFVIGNSDQQHVQDILNAFPGWWKEFPLLGVGVFAYIKSSGRQQELERSIQEQLESDGYNVPFVDAVQQPDGKFMLGMNPTRNG